MIVIVLYLKQFLYKLNILISKILQSMQYKAYNLTLRAKEEAIPCSSAYWRMNPPL